MARIELGLIVGVRPEIRESFDHVASVEVPTCQLAGQAESLVEILDPAKARSAAESSGVRISAVFFTFEGQRYNNADGPATMGLVPDEHGPRRLELAKRVSDLVTELDVDTIVSHIGFIPDDERDPLYGRFIDRMKALAEHAAANGQRFLFETGQELASTLRRTIADVGVDGVGVNLDPANLILYGKSDPLDAVELFGERVWGMHAKDGVWPNRDESLGKETPLGEGAVPFPVLIRRLKEKGFRGPITIEREISGPRQKADILKAKELLDPHLDLDD